MLKDNKRKVILSTVLTLVPTLIGFLLWNKLPDTMISHWGLDGAPDGYSTKLFTITVPFLLLVLVDWLCLFFTLKDKGNKNQNKKIMNLLFWIIPMISIFVGCFLYSMALGVEVDPKMWVMPLLGVTFILIGNYLPKCRQNVIVGIKIPWTLKNEENWNMTHRFGGKVWVIGGFIIMCAMFLPTPYSLIILLVGIFVLVLIPFIYSYRYYQKQKREGTWVINGVEYEKEAVKLANKISLTVLIPILVFIGMLMFTGNIHYKFEEEAFTIEADFYSDVSVKYENVKSISYRDDLKGGFRANGFGSARLSMGMFENEEFGFYTRYCYTGCKECVVLEVGDKMLVINGKDDAATKELYDTLQEKIR